MGALRGFLVLWKEAVPAELKWQGWRLLGHSNVTAQPEPAPGTPQRRKLIFPENDRIVF